METVEEVSGKVDWQLSKQKSTSESGDLVTPSGDLVTPPPEVKPKNVQQNQAFTTKSKL